MPTSIFTDKEIIPDEPMLSISLGKTFEIYKSIIVFLQTEFGDIRPEWKHYGKNYGWTLKVFYKKRNLFFIMPCDGFFKISFVFGKLGVAAVAQSDLPKDIIQTLVNAKQYAEGKGLQLEVKSAKVTKNIIKLIKLKINN